MNKRLVAVTALASGLLFMPLTQGAATPSGVAGLTSAAPITPGPVEFVKSGGGGGGGGGHGDGGGGAQFSGGGGGGGGGGGYSGGGHHGYAAGGGWSGAKNWSGSVGHGRSFAYSGRSHVYAGHTFDNSGAALHHGGTYAWHDRDNWNGHNWNDHNGHKYSHYRRYYPNVFVYGGDYGYGDCGWLLRQAEITGSPVWWNRYYACAG
jgi:hypothetical protein